MRSTQFLLVALLVMSTGEMQAAEEPAVSKTSIQNRPPSADQTADRLKQFETVMERYYRGSPLEKAQDSLNRLIVEYNQRVESTDARHDSARKELDKEYEVLRGLEKQIDEIGRLLAEKPDARDKAAVEAYNAQVERRNVLTKQYNELGKPFKEHQDADNDAVSHAQQEMKTRREQLDKQKVAVQRQITAYKRWWRQRTSLPSCWPSRRSASTACGA